MADEDGFTLLKQEMENEEIHIKVNAIHRLKTVILSISESATIDALIPYIESKFNPPFLESVCLFQIFL